MSSRTLMRSMLACPAIAPQARCASPLPSMSSRQRCRSGCNILNSSFSSRKAYLSRGTPPSSRVPRTQPSFSARRCWPVAQSSRKRPVTSTNRRRRPRTQGWGMTPWRRCGNPRSARGGQAYAGRSECSRHELEFESPHRDRSGRKIEDQGHGGEPLDRLVGVAIETAFRNFRVCSRTPTRPRPSPAGGSTPASRSIARDDIAARAPNRRDCPDETGHAVDVGTCSVKLRFRRQSALDTLDQANPEWNCPHLSQQCEKRSGLAFPGRAGS